MTNFIENDNREIWNSHTYTSFAVWFWEQQIAKETIITKDTPITNHPKCSPYSVNKESGEITSLLNTSDKTWDSQKRPSWHPVLGHQNHPLPSHALQSSSIIPDTLPHHHLIRGDGSESLKNALDILFAGTFLCHLDWRVVFEVFTSARPSSSGGS